MICEEYVVGEVMSLKKANENLVKQIKEQEEKIEVLQNIIDTIGKEATINTSSCSTKKYLYIPGRYEDDEDFALLARAFGLTDYD